jgi:hypothetical protein
MSPTEIGLLNNLAVDRAIYFGFGEGNAIRPFSNAA